MALCPCCSGKEYEECCSPIINGVKVAASAEEMMRSRYTAYTQSNVDYILNTTHPDKKHEITRKDVQEWADAADWQSLTIVEADAEGHVEFIAEFKDKGELIKHHELSTFKQLDGAWYFYDSDYPKQKTVVNSNKVGRNEPCPCGSGKKYKKCCGKKG